MVAPLDVFAVKNGELLWLGCAETLAKALDLALRHWRSACSETARYACIQTTKYACFGTGAKEGTAPQSLFHGKCTSGDGDRHFSECSRVPGRQFRVAHGYAYDSAHNLRFTRISEPQYLAF